MYYDACNGDVGAGYDCQAHKGVLFAAVNKGGRSYHVYGTHTDSDVNQADADARYLQFVALSQFIWNTENSLQTSTDNPRPVVIAGDMNVDRNQGSEYNVMISTLSVSLLPPYSEITRSATDLTPLPKISTDREYKWLDYVLVPTEARYVQPTKTTIRVVTPLIDISSWSAPDPYAFSWPYPLPVEIYAMPQYAGKGDLSDHFAVEAKYVFPN
jgi:hypothetical protein